MKISEKLISNTTYLFLSWFVTAIFSFVFWLLLGKTLPKQELGIVSTLNNFVILLSWISSLGITLAIQKLIPEINKKDTKKLYALTKISIIPIIIALVTMVLGLFIFSNQLSTILKVPSKGMLTVIFSLSMIVPYIFYGSVLYGIQDMRKLFLTDCFQIFLRVLISFLLVFLGFGFYGPLIGFGLGYLTGLIMRIDLRYFRNESSCFPYKKLFYYAFPAYILTVTSYVMSNSHYIILTIIKSPEVTGIFTIAFLLTSFLGVIINVLTYALFPTISSLSVDHKTKNKQGYLIGLVLRYSMVIIIPISIILLIFSKWFVLLFSSIEYITATDYFPILIPAAIMFGMGNIFNTNLFAIGKPKIPRNILIATTLLFLTTSIVSIYYFSALGLSFAYLVSMLFYFTLNLIYIRRFLRINFFVYDILKIFFSAALVMIILFTLYPYVQTITMVALLSILAGLFYLGILWFLNFYRFEDAKILEFFSRKIPFIGKYFLIAAKFIKRK